MSNRPEDSLLLDRIRELEERIQHLRVSRRVLMNLLEKVEREKGGIVSKLEYENRKLQLHNTRFAKHILLKNRQIIELQAKMDKQA